MSISIKAQKFTGTDLELIDFIQTKLENKFNEEFRKYFLKKETAIKVGELIKLYIEREFKDIQNLISISKSNDTTLMEQKRVIAEKDSINRTAYRISLLTSIKECKSYIEILKKISDYYSLKEFTTIMDIKYLSPLPSLLIFHFENIFYTSLTTDEENLFIKFILSNDKFSDYSFDFESTSDKKIKEKELILLIEKERIWKRIYNEISSEEKKQVASCFNFNLFSEENINYIESQIIYTELYELTTNNFI